MVLFVLLLCSGVSVGFVSIIVADIVCVVVFVFGVLKSVDF